MIAAAISDYPLTENQHRTVVVVLGARSGTSAMAGVLGLVGCLLPKKLMVANFANEKGYFEPPDIATAHDELLLSLGSSWSDSSQISPSWFGSSEANVYRRRLVSIFEENYGDAPLTVLKEPRMCRLLPLWNGVFEDLKVNPVFCFVDRNPSEVAASLRARDGSSMMQGLLYYIRNHLDAEHATRGRRRAFTSYDALLADWRMVITKVGEDLGVNFLAAEERQVQVDTFLEVRLKHQSIGSFSSEKNKVQELAEIIHSIFSRMPTVDSKEEALDHLDRLRDKFNTSPFDLPEGL